MLLGKRIRRNYEDPAQSYLTCRIPVIVRVDGRAFRTFTRDNFTVAISTKFTDAMAEAALVTSSGMQGFKLGYVFSDEASFLLTDYDNLDTQPWFQYNQSKLESVSASLMTAAFARCMRLVGVKDLATFDARAFNIPESEVANYFLWRAQNCWCNSVSMFAQTYFSHKELQSVSTAEMHNMLASEGHSWDRDLMDEEKLGSFILRNGELLTGIQPKFPEIEELWQQSKTS